MMLIDVAHIVGHTVFVRQAKKTCMHFPASNQLKILLRNILQACSKTHRRRRRSPCPACVVDTAAPCPDAAAPPLARSMTARRLPASTRPTTHCSATFSPSSISLEFHIPDDWICEKDKAVEHQEGMAKILRHTKKAPATKEVLLSFPPSPVRTLPSLIPPLFMMIYL
ncbi:hypothetical protein DAI22_08g241001 [Oryza sativa Japonica Group]|nr:hypothetical protein DAI22_08g241001 [Oryza sativa Japonica Group]